jgi:glycosyltransferase involved in cell wall biosynthesis
MRIAQVAPLVESVPPQLYGGTERVVSYLTEELVRLGHDVTLYATGDSRTAAHLVPLAPRALRLNPKVQDYLPYTYIQADRVCQDAHLYDVLHFHVDFAHFPLFRDQPDRVVTTLHGRLDLPDLVPFYREFPHMPLVSISNDQRKPMPPVRWMGTVHHGLPSDLYRYMPGQGGYLAFLGRISPEKGPERAIAIARATGMKLKMAAKVDRADREYFEARIRPLLDDPLIEFVGEVNEAGKQELLGNAAALLFPIDWPEPFGLVMIEAMACGTPTIAFPCGAVPEILEDGLTGFVVNSLGEAAEAVRHAGDLPRRRIRERFDQRFTARRMALNYVAIYDRMMKTASASIAAA